MHLIGAWVPLMVPVVGAWRGCLIHARRQWHQGELPSEALVFLTPPLTPGRGCLGGLGVFLLEASEDRAQVRFGLDQGRGPRFD